MEKNPLHFNLMTTGFLFRELLQERTNVKGNNLVGVVALGKELLAELHTNNGTKAFDYRSLALSHGYASTDAMRKHIDLLVSAGLLESPKRLVEQYDPRDFITKGMQLTIAPGGYALIQEVAAATAGEGRDAVLKQINSNRGRMDRRQRTKDTESQLEHYGSKTSANGVKKKRIGTTVVAPCTPQWQDPAHHNGDGLHTTMAAPCTPIRVLLEEPEEQEEPEQELSPTASAARTALEQKTNDLLALTLRAFAKATEYQARLGGDASGGVDAASEAVWRSVIAASDWDEPELRKCLKGWLERLHAHHWGNGRPYPRNLAASLTAHLQGQFTEELEPGVNCSADALLDAVEPEGEFEPHQDAPISVDHQQGASIESEAQSHQEVDSEPFTGHIKALESVSDENGVVGGNPIDSSFARSAVFPAIAEPSTIRSETHASKDEQSKAFDLEAAKRKQQQELADLIAKRNIVETPTSGPYGQTLQPLTA